VHIKITKTFFSTPGARLEKNPSQLTDSDVEVITQATMVCVAIISIAMTRYTSKQFGETILLQLARSKQRHSLLYQFLNATNLSSERSYTPLEFNQKIARVFLDSQQRDDTDTNREKHYLRSSQTTENLRTLEALGVYRNIIDKKEISKRKGIYGVGRRRAGNKSYNERGGRPSGDNITLNVERIKNTMAKPEACDLLMGRLLKLRLFHRFHKYVLTALYYALRKDRMVKNVLRIGQGAIHEYSEESINRFIDGLSSVDEGELSKTAQLVVDKSICYQKFDAWTMCQLFFPFL
jgi:hypothetical protein